MNNLDAIRPELDTLTKIIVETVPVEEIYLFGSYAYGTPNENSDLDLYVVLKDDTPMRPGEAMSAMGLAIYKIQKKPMDLLAMKKSRFLDRSLALTLEHTVISKGVKIYG